MYQEYSMQQSFFEKPEFFLGATLNPENRWVKLAAKIPWGELDEKYGQSFARKNFGRPAKSVRIAVSAWIIKKKFGTSDIETVHLIRENPYLQFFLGADCFSDEPPFDSSTMSHFRRRITPELETELEGYLSELGGK